MWNSEGILLILGKGTFLSLSSMLQLWAQLGESNSVTYNLTLALPLSELLPHSEAANLVGLRSLRYISLCEQGHHSGK